LISDDTAFKNEVHFSWEWTSEGGGGKGQF